MSRSLTNEDLREKMQEYIDANPNSPRSGPMVTLLKLRRVTGWNHKARDLLRLAKVRL